jgi:putative ABC transport system permease protein
VASTTRMPTVGDEDRAKAALDRILPNQLTVERGYPGGIAIGLITLAGTFTAVGLAAAEGRADVSTLAAAQAGVITIIGGRWAWATGCWPGGRWCG